MEVAIVQNKQELDRLEDIIRKGRQTFYEIGKALMEIRERKLYRDVLGYETFEEYCKDRWDFQWNYAYKQIAAAETMDNLKICTIVQKPENEGQLRPLTKLLPEQQVEAWQKVIENASENKITARLVNKIVKSIIHDETEKKTKKIIKEVEVVRVHPDFEKAYRDFYREVQNAKLNKWRETSKEEALRLVENIIALITIS